MMRGFVLTPEGDYELRVVIGRDEWDSAERLRYLMAAMDLAFERVGLFLEWSGY